MTAVIGVCRNRRDHPDLSNLGLEFLWLEAPLAARLARVSEVADWCDVNTWPAGRLFGEAGEYRWQRLANDRLQGVLLAEQPSLPAGFEDQLELTMEEETHLLLWGDWINPQADPEENPDGGMRFYAPELPQAQRYPLDASVDPSGKSAWLVARRYQHSEAGEFLRCVGFALEVRDDD